MAVESTLGKTLFITLEEEVYSGKVTVYNCRPVIVESLSSSIESERVSKRKARTPLCLLGK